MLQVVTMESKGEHEVSMLIAENYDNLAKAIVKHAVIEYREALRRLKYRLETTGLQDLKEQCYSPKVVEIEQFLQSDWFKILCNIDGQAVIEEMRRRFLGRFSDKL